MRSMYEEYDEEFCMRLEEFTSLEEGHFTGVFFVRLLNPLIPQPYPLAWPS